MIGVGGVDTGLGLFTLKEIPPNTFVCSYAPTASLRATTQCGDYAMELTVGGERISINGQENEYEIGLGIYANDGTFPFNLVGEKFSRSVTERINCKFSKRNNEVWLKSTRPIHANEELLVSYTPDGSYWTSLFTQDQLDKIKRRLGEVWSNTEGCRGLHSPLTNLSVPSPIQYQPLSISFAGESTISLLDIVTFT